MAALVEALGDINADSQILRAVLEDGPSVEVAVAAQIIAEDSILLTDPTVIGTASKELPPFWLN